MASIPSLAQNFFFSFTRDVHFIILHIAIAELTFRVGDQKGCGICIFVRGLSRIGDVFHVKGALSRDLEKVRLTFLKACRCV